MKMITDWKLIERQADPNCKKCKGKGWLPSKERLQDLGSGTAKIGNESFPVKDVQVNIPVRRICPVCFGPDGKPRDGERVLK